MRTPREAQVPDSRGLCVSAHTRLALPLKPVFLHPKGEGLGLQSLGQTWV